MVGNLCISILEFKFTNKAGNEMKERDLCISILEFK